MASVTLTMEEFNEIKHQRDAAIDAAEVVRRELTELKMLGAPGGMPLNGITEIARLSLDVVRFAVANLPPETTRGWPSAKLRALAARIPMLPDYTVDDGDLMNELLAFATECEAHAHRRNVSAERTERTERTDGEIREMSR